MRYLYNDNCLNVLPTLPDSSLDMVFTDLPYNITANKWDVALPLDILWKEWKRILKPNGVVILNSCQPFTSLLVTSQPKWFRCEWIWDKCASSGFLNANVAPLRQHV